jgi:hypothetical protein
VRPMLLVMDVRCRISCRFPDATFLANCSVCKVFAKVFQLFAGRMHNSRSITSTYGWQHQALLWIILGKGIYLGLLPALVWCCSFTISFPGTSRPAGLACVCFSVPVTPHSFRAACMPVGVTAVVALWISPRRTGKLLQWFTTPRSCCTHYTVYI